MESWGAKIAAVQSADEDTRRRGRLVIIIAIGMTVLALAFLPVILTISFSVTSLVTLLVAAVIFASVVLLARSGHVNLGAYILIGLTLVAIALSIPSSTASSSTPYYMMLVVLFAGVLLPPIQIWAVLACAIAGVALGIGLLPPALRESVAWRQTTVGAPLLLVVVALVTFLSARGTVRALAVAEQSRAQAEEASRALAANNSALEVRVEERTRALRQTADEQRAVAAQLESSLAAQRDLNRVIAELSVPIIPISDNALVVPLVGSIDSGRAEQLLGSVLAQLEASGARTVVLDVTGVPIVDTQVAAALLRVAGATRLMGAEAILVGIRPEVAQTLVHLGVEIGSLRTAATLRDGLLTIGVTRQR
jgi:anti-anti-sigma regulatory factor